MKKEKKIPTGYIDLDRFEAIKKELRALVDRKANIPIEDVPIELQEGLLDFLTGRTMAVKAGKPVALVGDFIEYYQYLWRSNIK